MGQPNRTWSFDPTDPKLPLGPGALSGGHSAKITSVCWSTKFMRIISGTFGTLGVSTGLRIYREKAELCSLTLA